MTEHTPTTEVVKDAACFPRDRLGEPRGIDTDAFDRWLATVEAAAEQRGAARELRQFAHAQDTWCVEGRAEQRISRIAMRDALLKRADLLEG